MDFCCFFNFSTDSKRILLKQDGIVAKIEGVVSGSNSRDRVLSPEARTSIQDSMAIESLRGHIMYHGTSNMSLHWINISDW
jgi:hypothetical protein